MPQLDFGNPLLIAQIVWLLIIFGLLYYVMSTYALPRVESVLEERRARIAADLAAAQAAKAEADSAMAAHRDATAKARAEAQSSIASAMQQAQAEAAARGEELNKRLSRQIEEAEQRIGAARDAAMGALRQVSLETAESLVAKVAGGADRGRLEAAVDRALAARAG
ncbi:F0F1 ATP synthase subunit B' [Roseomonas sp. AR75]|uniref:F0F1 ATP synthase subunit B family protein n=1 Tax=Roseomonas sp. AR75 TaxID=2562311 RepID=UPI001F10FF3D|nr:F0F1 ATP synthase subunit B' [Roseomonas sp. AR75]